MKTEIKIALAACAALVSSASSCATTPPGASGFVQTPWGMLAEPIGTYMIPPSSQKTFTYASTDEFDRSLHASMKGNTTPITITVPASANLKRADLSGTEFTLGADDQRLKRWVYQVRQSGGNVYSCTERPSESAWAILGMLVNLFMPAINEFLTYRPADAYHAVVFYDPASDRVMRVKMLLRSSVDGANLTCEQASALT